MTDGIIARIGGMNANLRGMAWMLVATVTFSAMHIIIRYTAEDLPVMVVVFFRNLLGVVTLVPIFMRYGLTPLKTERMGLLSLRAFTNTLAMCMYFTALAIAPVADVTALGFSAPIFATVLAVMFLGEKVHIRRWAAILAGFLGTFLIIRPGFAEVDIGMWLVVASSVAWAGTLHVIKILARTESSLTITAYMLLMMTPLTLIPALFYWEWPTWEQMGWMVLMAIFGTIAQLAMTEAMKLGDTNVVMPVDFLRLIWMALGGWLIFGQIPDTYTWLGGAIIFGSATYIAIREAQKGAKTAEPRPPST